MKNLAPLDLACAAAVALAACTGDATAPTDATPPPNFEIRLYGPSALQVHEASLCNAVILRDGVRLDSAVTLSWASSDTTVATVESGAVIARQRGTAVIVASAGRARDSVVVRVWARLKIRIAGADITDHWVLSTADSVRLEPVYVDVNGVPIDERPSASWASSDTSAATVAASGVVTARFYGDAAITAVADGGPATLAVHVVWSGAGGIPVRFASAIPGPGQAVLALNDGDTVRLAFGDSVVRSVPPGSFFARLVPHDSVALGYPADRAATLQAGDHLSIYVVGNDVEELVGLTWGASRTLPADSGRIRVVQGVGTFPVIFLRPSGAPADGIAQLCYTDPAASSDYFTLPAGGYDIVLETKIPSVPIDSVRIPITVPPGHSATYVLVGDSRATMSVLAFPDP